MSMKCILAATVAVLLLANILRGTETENVPPWKKHGFVPDSATALSVARAILIPIYGKERIAAEEPFSAVLDDDEWVVTGSLPEGKVGGVARIEISKSTCCVLSVSHGK